MMANSRLRAKDSSSNLRVSKAFSKTIRVSTDFASSTKEYVTGSRADSKQTVLPPPVKATVSWAPVQRGAYASRGFGKRSAPAMVKKLLRFSRLSVYLRATLVGTCFFLFGISQASAVEPRRVLLVHAFGHAYSPWSDMAGSFRPELIKKSKEPIDLYEVSLDTARVKTPEDETPFVEYIRALLGGRRLDLIVPIGAPSAFFMQRNRQRLFPETPMLILGADRRRIANRSLLHNDTAVLLDLDLPAYLTNILRLRPDTTHVAVVVGNSPVERYWTSELHRDFEPFADRVKIEWFNDLTFDDMLNRAAAMPPRSTIFWFLLSEDAAGVPYSQDRALETMREVASVPLFGMGDYEMGRGIIGGPLMQIQKLGQQGAEVALRILKGENPSAIKSPPVVFGAPVYDWRELRRWNIAETSLPRESIVQFREASMWERYRWHITAVAAILLTQAAVIAGLVLERRRRRIAELELRRRLMEVIHLNRSAVAGALSASVAHELNQPLAAIQCTAEAAMLHLKANPPNTRRVEDLLGNIIRDDCRAARIVSHLRGLLKKRDDAELQEFDLNEVMHDALEIVGAEALRKGIEVCSSNVHGPLPVRGNRVQVQQVILNLAMNAIDAMSDCQSAQKRVSINSVLVDESAVEISVSDCGIGIVPAHLNQIFEAFYTTKGHGTGLGLSIARTIVEMYGGRIWAENRPGGGAILRFTLPLSHTSARTIEAQSAA
jgi:signal transduction histidine kinase